MPEPTTEKGRETAERILDAAERLFSARNPGSVTVRDIAQEAGVTHALVHNYFGGKEDLLRRVIHRTEPQFEAVAKASSDIAECVSEQVDLTFRDRAYVQMLTRAIMDGIPYEDVRPELETQRAMVECTKRTIESGRSAAPAPRDMDPRVTVAAVTALAMGWQATSGWVLHVCDLSDEDPEWLRGQLERVFRAMAEFALPE